MTSRAARTVDVTALMDDRRLSAFNYRLIALSWIITVFDGLDIMMVSFTAPYMRDELHLTKAMLGNIFAIGTAGMVIGGLACSYVGDRIGRRPMILACAFTFGILTIATGLTSTYEALLALRFLDGLAIGGMLPLAWALNIEFVPKRMRSTVVAVIMMGYSLGSAGAGPLTNLIAPTHGWEGVYIAGGVGTLICAVALAINLPESVRFLVSKGRKPDLVARTIRRVIPASDVRPDDHFILGDEQTIKSNFHIRMLFEGRLAIVTPLLWLGYTVSSLAIYFGANWGPSVLEELHIPRQTAAWVSATGSLLGAFGGVLVMRINDRHGLWFVALAPALAVPLLLANGFGLVPIGAFKVAVILQATLIGAEHAAIISICGIFYPSAIRASGAGSVSSFGKIGGVLGPLIGAVVLSSGLPILRSYAILAICPAVLCACFLGIAAATRIRVHPEPEDVVDVVPAS
jgi:AAHS family 4-hydroxybenzoate transporter-like MFS transporter